MKLTAALFPLLLLTGCVQQTAKTNTTLPLFEVRQSFDTVLIPSNPRGEHLAQPPSGVFNVVHYPAKAGPTGAYLTPDPADGKKHPAIVWITGGDCNSIGDVWSRRAASNDQTAAAYRKAGITMMFPSLRGGNDSPGVKEGFLGEVDDVIAATDYLAKQPYVDPSRIYLGGHSTGGTLALLVAECSKRYRAVFAFGPVAVVSGYGADSGFLPFDISNKAEVTIRSPGYWLKDVASPTWVIEGTQPNSNVDELRIMRRVNHNTIVHFVEVSGASHFSTLAPTNALIAGKILADSGPTTNVNISEAEVRAPFTVR